MGTRTTRSVTTAQTASGTRENSVLIAVAFAGPLATGAARPPKVRLEMGGWHAEIPISVSGCKRTARLPTDAGLATREGLILTRTALRADLPVTATSQSIVIRYDLRTIIAARPATSLGKANTRRFHAIARAKRFMCTHAQRGIQK